MSISVGNSHRSAGLRPTTLEEDREFFVDVSSILCLWFEIQGMRTYNFLTEFQTLMSVDLTDDKSTLFQVMAWCYQRTSLYLSLCWPRSMSPYGIIRPQCVKCFAVNSLTPEDDIWQHRTLSTLVQVTACWLKAPSYYLNYCLLDVMKS